MGPSSDSSPQGSIRAAKNIEHSGVWMSRSSQQDAGRIRLDCRARCPSEPDGSSRMRSTFVALDDGEPARALDHKQRSVPSPVPEPRRWTMIEQFAVQSPILTRPRQQRKEIGHAACARRAHSALCFEDRLRVLIPLLHGRDDENRRTHILGG